MNDSTRRAIRSAFDLVPAVLAAMVVVVPVLGLPAAQVAKVGAVVTAITLALSKIRNAMEDAGLIPAVLKAPASDGQDPLPDPECAGEVPAVPEAAAEAPAEPVGLSKPLDAVGVGEVSACPYGCSSH